MDGYHHCTKCGQKYRINGVPDGQEYEYTCPNCGQIETFHMSGKHSTIDCPICRQTVEVEPGIESVEYYLEQAKSAILTYAQKLATQEEGFNAD